MIYRTASRYANALQQEAWDLCDYFNITASPNDPGRNDQRDAYRHAYASAVAAFEHGELFAFTAGWLREITHPNNLDELNMDLWNNQIGRQIGSSATSREEIAQMVYDSLQCGDLITEPSDTRSYFDTYGSQSYAAPSDPYVTFMPGPSCNSPIDKARDSFDSAKTTVSPIILDLDGDGVETIASGDGAYFDHDGNGFAEQTGWAGADDGMLVRDINSDGLINDGKELFGDHTLLNNGSNAANGFQALSELDNNADGKVDTNDAAFSSLKIWKDSDGDGNSTASELHTLDELGIQSINTAYTTSTTVDANGNEHRPHSCIFCLQNIFVLLNIMSIEGRHGKIHFVCTF